MNYRHLFSIDSYGVHTGCSRCIVASLGNIRGRFLFRFLDKAKVHFSILLPILISTEMWSVIQWIRKTLCGVDHIGVLLGSIIKISVPFIHSVLLDIFFIIIFFLTVQGVFYRVEFRNVPGRTEKTFHEAYISCILLTVYYRNEFCCVHSFNWKQTLIVEITPLAVETVFVHPMELVFVMLDGVEKIVP